MPPEQPNQVLVTPDNRGPLINLATWLTLVVMCLATFTKIGSKLRKIGRLQGDDFLMFAAMVPNDTPIPLPAKKFLLAKKLMLMNAILISKKKQVVAIGQTIAIANQVTAGLGRHINSLTTSQIDRYQKVSFPAPFPPPSPHSIGIKNQKFESYLNA